MRDLAVKVASVTLIAVMFSAGMRVMVDLTLLLEGQPIPTGRLPLSALAALVAFKLLVAVRWRA